MNIKFEIERSGKISAGEASDQLREKGLGFPLTVDEEDEEEKLLRQAIALSLEGTEEADKKDEELLKQATVPSFDGAEKNDKWDEDDEEELLKQAIAMSLAD